MLIHFICRGNTYRSRLAETYLNSKQLPDIKAISSGVEADHNLSGPITWWAQRIIQNDFLQDFESFKWQKTTKKLLENSNINIFMNTDVYDFCLEHIDSSVNNYQIWNIPDMEEQGKEDVWVIEQSEKYFGEIKKKTEELIVHLHLDKSV